MWSQGSVCPQPESILRPCGSTVIHKLHKREQAPRAPHCPLHPHLSLHRAPSPCCLLGSICLFGVCHFGPCIAHSISCSSSNIRVREPLFHRTPKKPSSCLTLHDICCHLLSSSLNYLVSPAHAHGHTLFVVMHSGENA